jgi:hypothetical protein
LNYFLKKFDYAFFVVDLTLAAVCNVILKRKFRKKAKNLFNSRSRSNSKRKIYQNLFLPYL